MMRACPLLAPRQRCCIVRRPGACGFTPRVELCVAAGAQHSHTTAPCARVTNTYYYSKFMLQHYYNVACDHMSMLRKLCATCHVYAEMRNVQPLRPVASTLAVTPSSDDAAHRAPALPGRPLRQQSCKQPVVSQWSSNVAVPWCEHCEWHLWHSRSVAQPPLGRARKANKHDRPRQSHRYCSSTTGTAAVSQVRLT